MPSKLPYIYSLIPKKIGSLPSVKLTAKAPEIGLLPQKETSSYSNHPLSSAFAVSFREGNNPLSLQLINFCETPESTELLPRLQWWCHVGRIFEVVKFPWHLVTSPRLLEQTNPRKARKRHPFYNNEGGKSETFLKESA